MDGSINFVHAEGVGEQSLNSLRELLRIMKYPFRMGDRIGIKLHWGERGNQSFLPPSYAREIVQCLVSLGAKPFVFDTTVLYSGGRRNGADALETARQHGYHEGYLGCPVVVADGMDGRNVIYIKAGYRHFQEVQVASVFDAADGYVIFSHFKGHMASGFGGSIKNISMGFASRAQKQRMHADVKPVLIKTSCSRCGLCIEICPAGAAIRGEDDYPLYNHELCVGCAQCIGLCPEEALEISWQSDQKVFQEKLVETSAAVWKKISNKTILINALLKITADCDCLPGRNPVIARDKGFIGGYHPTNVDAASIMHMGHEAIDNTHPHVPWRHQFHYCQSIGFHHGKIDI